MKKLFEIEKYRAVVKHAVRSNWQAIEDDLMDDHNNRLQSEISIAKELNNVCSYGLTCKPECNKNHYPIEHERFHEFLDSVPTLISHSGSSEKIDATITTCKDDLADGPAGLSGLVPSLLHRLIRVKQELHLTRDRIADSTLLLDSRFKYSKKASDRHQELLKEISGLREEQRKNQRENLGKFDQLMKRQLVCMNCNTDGSQFDVKGTGTELLTELLQNLKISNGLLVQLIAKHNIEAPIDSSKSSKELMGSPAGQISAETDINSVMTNILYEFDEPLSLKQQEKPSAGESELETDHGSNLPNESDVQSKLQLMNQYLEKIIEKQLTCNCKSAELSLSNSESIPNNAEIGINAIVCPYHARIRDMSFLTHLLENQRIANDMLNRLVARQYVDTRADTGETRDPPDESKVSKDETNGILEMGRNFADLKEQLNSMSEILRQIAEQSVARQYGDTRADTGETRGDTDGTLEMGRNIADLKEQLNSMSEILRQIVEQLIMQTHDAFEEPGKVAADNVSQDKQSPGRDILAGQIDSESKTSSLMRQLLEKQNAAHVILEKLSASEYTLNLSFDEVLNELKTLNRTDSNIEIERKLTEIQDKQNTVSDVLKDLMSKPLADGNESHVYLGRGISDLLEQQRTANEILERLINRPVWRDRGGVTTGGSMDMSSGGSTAVSRPLSAGGWSKTPRFTPALSPDSFRFANNTESDD